ncbi:MAG TPA: hypothetical protein VG125_00455 [Pirellulales bacterium]|jgi:hypothetical protein|nr:hypothetical protein [Pirellulales bacterium]
MDDQRRPHAWTRWTAIILAISLIVYPLSVGPAALTVSLTGSREMNRVGATFYYPLSRLPQPLYGWVTAWKDMWADFGPPMPPQQ